jgi:hypothetical protein
MCSPRHNEQQAHQKSYHPTGRAHVDAALALVERLTRGYADWFERAFSYLLIGGFSVMVNLVVFSLLYYRVLWPADQQWHYVVAFAVQTPTEYKG